MQAATAANSARVQNAGSAEHDHDADTARGAEPWGTGSVSPPVVLSIAGFDPSSGAGINADLKVFAAHGFYGVAAATALTVQSTRGVRRVEAVSPTLLAETLACLAEDLPLAGVKIGMLATAANVKVVADFLVAICAHRPALPIVLDPVLRSSSGRALLEAAGLDQVRARLLPLVTCVTPNTDELWLLAGREPAAPRPSRSSVVEAVEILAGQFQALAILATGGHLDPTDDYLFVPGVAPQWLPGARVQTTATHGTGCAHSSALLCGLVAGCSVLQAAESAKQYVTAALRAATPMGAGGGSMQHFYAGLPSYKQPPGANGLLEPESAMAVEPPATPRVPGTSGLHTREG